MSVKLVIFGGFGIKLKIEKIQKEIAKELGITCSYVSKIEKRDFNVDVP